MNIRLRQSLGGSLSMKLTANKADMCWCNDVELLLKHLHDPVFSTATFGCFLKVFFLVAFIINNLINPICLNSFTIKSRSARRHLRKIWLLGEIFVSHAHWIGLDRSSATDLVDRIADYECNPC